MTRRAVIIEIEELLFDTRDMRVDALQAALLVGNVVVSRDDVLHAHAGRPAIVALTRLDAASVLDATARRSNCRHPRSTRPRAMRCNNWRPNTRLAW